MTYRLFLLLYLAILPFAAQAKLTSEQMGLVINDLDPDSVAIGEYYQVKRGIPARNIVHVKLRKARLITVAEFQAFKAQVDAALGPNVQAVAMAWNNPSRVGCNSITAALTMGYAPSNPCGDKSVPNDPSFDAKKLVSPYYDSDGEAPFTDFKMRISMMLAGRTVADAKAMIDRGVASDGTHPKGRAVILDTADAKRNIRAKAYTLYYHFPLGYALSPCIDVQVLKANLISNTNDVMFYFQGVQDMKKYTDPKLNNVYPPGAVVDNLTSFGGFLDNGANMLNHVAAPNGATASYGTVSEPYAYLSKFPDPKVMVVHYTAGDTVVEAYWKSVRVPFQGLFIGEPLASPYQTQDPSPECRSNHAPRRATN